MKSSFYGTLLQLFWEMGTFWTFQMTSEWNILNSLQNTQSGVIKKYPESIILTAKLASPREAAHHSSLKVEAIFVHKSAR